MNSEYSQTGVHWAIKALAIALLFVGLPQLLGGIYLIALGGSWYYLLAGAGICASAIMLWRGRELGISIYLAVLAFTILWSLYEVGFSFWGSVPRLVAPLAIGATLLFFSPLLRGAEQPRASMPYLLGGGALAGAFVAFMVGMFIPHGVISNDLPLTPGSVSSTTQAAGTDWYTYGRTGYGSRYVPTAQITPANIDGLEIAWTARTGFIADQTKFLDDQNTPIYVGGGLYQCAPAGQVTALDGDTGKIRWQFDPKAESSDWKRCRSLAYFDPGPDDSCGPRIIETTVDSRLIALRASDGKPCETFGDKGTVNVFQGMGKSNPEYLTLTSGPIVVNGKIIFGARVTDNVSEGEPSGVIRGYDAKTGALSWVWDLGQPALQAVPGETPSYTLGSPNVWSLLSYDADLGLVYLPLGNATPDIYGGQRRKFDDEYSSSVVALNVATGKEVWKFQTVRHDLWDYDIPAQPVLADIPDGKGGFVPGLIQVTKRAQTFVLDRRTGVPIKAVEDRPAPKSDGTIKGEYYAPTQPYSPQMAAIGTEPLQETSMWGATPIDQMLCRIQFR